MNFETKLFTINGWTILRLPKATSIKLPSRGQVMVKGAINGVPFETPLEPDGNGSHWFRVDGRLRSAAAVSSGDTVGVTLEPTKEWPEPPVPADVQVALDHNQQAKAMWSRITPMARWEWLRWIGSTKHAETRARRIEVSCSKMTNGERRPCCFNRSMCCIPDVARNGVLLDPATT